MRYDWGRLMWGLLIDGMVIASVLALAWPRSDRPRLKRHAPPEFLTDLEAEYGYGGNVLDAIRDQDMTHVNGSTYLDYTGSGLYRTSQIQAVVDDYNKNLYANPHSLSPASQRSTEQIEAARQLVLEFLGTSSQEYQVIFTASATASLRLLAEAFPWTNGSLYLYSRDNHNSVLGLRRWASHFGSGFRMVDWDELEGNAPPRPDVSYATSHLFAFPAEENFAGRKFDLRLIRKFRDTQFGDKFAKVPGRWFTLLDAAAYVSTTRLNLTVYPADFVALSFYKIFGFPNLGALVVRNAAFEVLRKIGFAGGSVVMATCGKDFAYLQPRGCDRYEDGTVPFLSIVSLKHGFARLNELGIDNITRHAWVVTRELFTRLNRLRHKTGRSVCEIYGAHEKDDPRLQGSIVTLNFRRADGSYVGYDEVMRKAAVEGINIRVGCFCNPGSCTRATKLSDDEVERYYVQKTSCGDSIDIVDGRPLGAVRISLGMYSSMEDVEKFAEFARRNFAE